MSRDQTPADAVALPAETLARLMPMHLVLTGAGRVRGFGPLLRRLFPGQRLRGRSFLQLFAIRAPRQVAAVADIIARPGQKLHLSPRSGPGAGLRLRGTAMPADGAGGLIVNLSFGIDVVRAVGLLRLTDADFAPTELAMELLFTAEANGVVVAGMRAMSARLETARVQAQEEALTDPLTGLRNRRACDSFLARQCREGGAFTLLHLDLDYFKQVNDTFGHAAGDAVLQRVADVLRREARSVDCLARVGGDEFVAILPGLSDPGRLRRLSQTLIDGLSQPMDWQGEAARVAASIGMVRIAAGQHPDPGRVLEAADVALYAAKEAGRARAVLAEDLGLRPDAADPQADVAAESGASPVLARA